jgi:pimeloyl-ACP methyl ester carboxylesterase
MAQPAFDLIPGEAGDQGAPVVLLGGAGDVAASWHPVRSRLTASAAVLTYDRAGLGQSAHLSARPCTLDRYLAELDGVLDAALGASRPPVLLVGHSLGGLIAAAYARRHPSAVSGLVLVDATPPQAGSDRAVVVGFIVSAVLARALRTGTWVGLTQLLLRLRLMPAYSGQRQLQERLTEEEYRRWRALVTRSFRHGAAAELRTVPAAARATKELMGDDGRSFGDLPLAVVSSSAYGPKWEAWQAQLAEGSRWRVHHRTGDRSHDVHLRHPHLVAGVVEQVLAEVSSRRQARGSAEGQARARGRRAVTARSHCPTSVS